MMTECYPSNISPLDRILEEGFKRMDEAVEGVIRKDSLDETLKGKLFVYDESLHKGTYADKAKRDVSVWNDHTPYEAWAAIQHQGLYYIAILGDHVTKNYGVVPCDNPVYWTQIDIIPCDS